MADYTEKHCQTLRSPETARYHAYRIGQWLDGRRASEVRQVVAAIVDDLQQVYKPATINRSLDALSKALSRAWERGATPVDYSTAVRRLKASNARTVTLTMPQVRDVATRASINVRTAIWISLFTGLRRGEICKLQPADIADGVIRVQAGNTKTLRYREVPVVPAVKQWLARLPLPIQPDAIKAGFTHARIAAGLPHCTFHDIRRSCGTLMLQAGVPMHVVSKILGHTSVRVTEQRYAFLDDGTMRAALGKLENIHSGLHSGRKRGRPTERRI